MKKVVLVTGGARGIGRGMVRHFADRGWGVAVLDVEPCPKEEGVLAVRGDVADEDAVRAALAKVLDACGRLDGLVNNAGIAAPGRTRLEELDRAAWDRVLAVNLTGPMLVAKHAAPHLRAARGAIVNIASTRALQSEPHTYAYTASKGGLTALTHALAVSLGPEIRVNCISPGWIDTRDPNTGVPWSEADHAQHPAGRVGRPSDIAALAEFLLSPEAGFITGQSFVADGGMTKKMIYA